MDDGFVRAVLANGGSKREVNVHRTRAKWLTSTFSADALVKIISSSLQAKERMSDEKTKIKAKYDIFVYCGGECINPRLEIGDNKRPQTVQRLFRFENH